MSVNEYPQRWLREHEAVATKFGWERDNGELLKVQRGLIDIAELSFVTQLTETTEVMQGDRIELNVEVEGGDAPYTYTWRNSEDLTFEETTNTLALTESANYNTLNGITIYVDVTDSSDNTITSSTLISIKQPT